MAKHSVVIEKMVKANSDKFDEYRCEGEDGHWVYLKFPYRCSFSDSRCCHEYTAKETIEAMKAIFICKDDY